MAKDTVVHINAPEAKKLLVKVRAKDDTCYVGTCFSDEVQKEIVAKQMGLTTTKAREKRNLELEAESRRHKVQDERGKEIDCIPARAFFSALVSVASELFKNNKQTDGKQLRRAVSTIRGEFGDMVPLKKEDGTDYHPGPEFRTCIVSIPPRQKKNNPIKQPTYPKWSAEIEIVFLPEIYSEETVINLLMRAGIMIGIGDDRNIGGGRFEVYEATIIE